jgi:hypothetical protein
MKKRILLIMTLLLAVASRSMAIVTEYGFYVGGVWITSSNYKDIIGAIQKEDARRITVGEGGSITYLPYSNTLTLKNVTITRTGGKNRGITNESNTDLTVVFEGTVKLDAQDASPILCKANTTLKCANGGKVTLNSDYSDGLTANGCTIYIQDADMLITRYSDGGAVRDGSGIMSDDHNGYVEIYNSKVWVNVYKHSVYNLKSLKIGGVSEVRLYGGPYLTVNNLDDLTLDADMVFDYPTGARFNSSKKTVVSDDYPDGCRWTVSFSTKALQVNDTNFPDKNFQACVSEQADKNSDGYLTRIELDNCKSLNLSYKHIKDLKGIEHFTQLETLDCSGNLLEGFNITKCTALKSLICYDNNLTSITVPGYKALTTLECYNNSQLTSLNVSGCTALKTLKCYNTQIKSLSVLDCTALETLHCYDNPMTSLYTKALYKLTTLLCYNNQLKLLDVSNCSALNTLECDNNQLINLNLVGCKALKTLKCGNNKLEKLEIRSCQNLETLDCSNNQLTLIDVLESMPYLKTFKCYNNILKSLYIKSCPSLTKIICYYNSIGTSKFSSISTANKCEVLLLSTYDNKEHNDATLADIRKMQEKGIIVSVEYKGMWYKVDNAIIQIHSTYFSDQYFRAYLMNQSYGTDQSLSYADILGVTSIDVSDKNIESLKGIDYFIKLTTLECSKNKLTTLDVSKCVQLQELYCANNALTSLKVPNNAQYLKKVYCQVNNLSEDAFSTLLSQKIGYSSGCEIYVHDRTSAIEQNKFNSSLRALAESNNWKPYYYDSDGWHSGWEDVNNSIVTAINAVTAQEETTYSDAPRYNLQGQRVGNDYHGVVITNGRKFRVK